jgi:hypothetical protein
MIHAFTLEELINHTYEEIETEGRRRGLYKSISPRRAIIQNIFNYSQVLYVLRSQLIGTFNLVLN